MTDRRTPRAHLSKEALDDEAETGLPSVRPDLVEHLETAFPVRLSAIPNTSDHIQQDQARLTGQQEVIDYLRKLSNRQS